MKTIDQAGCYYKQGFQNKRQAHEIMQRTNRRRDRALNIYRCSCCSLFHIGTPSLKQ